jgi:hypothetical protein
MARQLAAEHWDNCKVEYSMPHAYGLALRAARLGLDVSDLRRAYAAALLTAHGLATDRGAVWVPSGMVARLRAVLDDLAKTRRAQVDALQLAPYFGPDWRQRVEYWRARPDEYDAALAAWD